MTCILGAENTLLVALPDVEHNCYICLHVIKGNAKFQFKFDERPAVIAINVFIS